MGVVIVIPARYDSTRFPGKPLVMLRGATGVSRSLIERTWNAAKLVRGIDRVVIATDDGRIAAASHGFGAEVLLTSANCQNGTERCAEALDQLSDAEIIVNLQGDAPLTPPWFVESLVEAMAKSPEMKVATPVLRCDAATLNTFLEDRGNHRVGGTTAVFDLQGTALYFSKEVVPYVGRQFAANEMTPVFHHVGVYAYRKDALARYRVWPTGNLEKWEGLEQLRFIENGCAVNCVEVAALGKVFWELNNPVDVPRIESILLAQGQV